MTTIAGGASFYITNLAELTTFVGKLRERLADDPRLGLDTEFIRERTYTPLLEVVQIAADHGRLIGLIDVPSIGIFDLGPLGELLLDPAIEKIVHAGGQDMEILALRLGRPPANVYDTQVAAAFAGYSLQTGYGPLVQSVLGMRLSKEEGFADWSRRPLTPAMRDYAENDVRYLHALHDRLTALLEKRGRLEWAREQMDRQLLSAAEPQAPERLYERVGGRNVLDSRGLAILRELALWRDTEAQRRDKPRRSVVKDDFLVEVARRASTTVAEIVALRSAPQNLGERAAEGVAAAVKKGLAVPPAERPQPDVLPVLDDAGAALMELLTAVVKVRAIEENLPAALLASGEELRTLVAQRNHTRGGRVPAETWDSALFTGWRGAILGLVIK